MFLPPEAICENFIETVGGQSSGSLFIGRIFSPSQNFPHSKEDLSFLHRSLVVDLS
jgi:hypothetical protein